MRGQSSPGKMRGLGEDHAGDQDLAQDQGGRLLHQFCAKFHQKNATLKPLLYTMNWREENFAAECCRNPLIFT
eukprot:CAMPEP_0172587900 /NCGR_PEP_ID=MMETSP1068-20121228/6885_1 /TAXON_ID=35684 /ORGANISM="Pseudopedinella elastica, Strain CCMP716" /LENGTH=72 /DNA_ID=CAMNT_0013383071 /DNA_START=663 /DNA_END=878 /DNA_ORIENTATION=+